MFQFNLEPDVFTSSYYTKSNELKFDPPVYEQRYCLAVRILEHEIFKGHIKKVVDFGCAELKLFEMLKRIAAIEHILEVDIDEDLLTKYSQRVKPLVSDYLDRRKIPLRADIYKGSIDSSVECLRNTDGVIAIEIIEHLYPEIFENVPYNIFGYMQPKVAIFSTPNSEFNILFNLSLPNGFRHEDHKFEWTRNQFQDWCYNICKRFPNYQVSFLGAGKCPESKLEPDVGYVTQIAIFIRNDIRNLPLVEDINAESPKLDDTTEYKLVYSVEFPFSNDQRSFDERLLDDLKYHIFRYMNMADRFYNDIFDIYEIPMGDIYEFLYPSVMSMDELKTFLSSNQYLVNENNMIIIKATNNSYDTESQASNSGDSDHSCEDDSVIRTMEIVPEEVWE